MSSHEYIVIPAPERGDKIKGAKTAAERFAHTLTDELNRMAADGWEYLRAEILPTEERSGLTGRNTVYHNMLVFRRMIPPADRRPDAKPSHAPFTQPMPTAPVQQASQPLPPQLSASPEGGADEKTPPEPPVTPRPE